MSMEGKKILITGGFGFIGLNAAKHFSQRNHVLVVDDGSRMGTEISQAYLKAWNIPFVLVDVSHMQSLRTIVQEFSPDVILHLAAQVAVTLSVSNPMRDFTSNVLGTLNILEIARLSKVVPIVIYASSNKVYGTLGNEILKDGRYTLPDRLGYDENVPLSFKTPYGCSKGAADQYVLDYFATYGVPTVVMRQSCIYGPYQYGFEDQGWVAWFAGSAVLKNQVTVYGDGFQVRDILYISDLLDAYEKAIINIDKVKGQALNIGGGPDKALSVNELISLLNKKLSITQKVIKEAERLYDQKVFICDISKVKKILNWSPKVSMIEGIDHLLEWIKEEKETIKKLRDSQQYVGKRIDISLVIPARNEEESLPKVLNEIAMARPSFQYNTEVIVVNDHSTDKTVEVAKSYPFVRVVENLRKPGKGHALRAGFEQAQGEYIAMMDADLSHNIVELSGLIEEARRHQGMVVGSRITGGSEEYTPIRAFGNIILTWFFGLVHGRYLSDAINGYKVFHHEVFKNYEYTSQNFEIEIELLVNTLRLGKPITEIPSHERSRVGGKAKSLVIKHGTLFALRILWDKFRTVKVHNG